MDKERLEMIKIDAFKNRNYDITKLMHGDVVWLIEQAERVEEQQKELEGRKKFESQRAQQVNNLIGQNKRYREALKFYAPESKYVIYYSALDGIKNDIYFDSGSRARKELAE
ncbi:hypothetical protein [Lederbergia lenta]|uniref:hypothetical protein n=1 Tax=Lederbergia lenta TaxID=1467 RepID=UPI00203B704B|nr:hypothetical protein [Lederbergia lenta]MCM3111657.1 hypothetical protein [Lederbergia lenta]